LLLSCLQFKSIIINKVIEICSECLEELGLLIDNYGISVSQPTPAAALKEIARQISDRDNSVRTAALNCVVQAWHQEGDKIYKMIGQVPKINFFLIPIFLLILVELDFRQRHVAAAGAHQASRQEQAGDQIGRRGGRRPPHQGRQTQCCGPGARR